MRRKKKTKRRLIEEYSLGKLLKELLEDFHLQDKKRLKNISKGYIVHHCTKYFNDTEESDKLLYFHN